MTSGSQRRIAELEEENAQLREQLAVKEKLAVKAVASYQERALQMEIIRQQNEDLDNLAGDLAASKKVAEDRAREVERASKLKSEFLANFSHEIRTPLNGIIGYCDLLSREEGENLTAHGRKDLNTIRNNARTLLALINDILDLSKIESGHVEVVKEPVDVHSMVEESLATVREYVKGKEVQLRSRIDEAAAHAFTDPVKLRQILLNLLSNAAKFTELGEVSVDVKVDGTSMKIAVEDTGDGIAPEQLPHIFEKFRQADGTSTRSKGGSGLGLAIVRELSRLLGGDATVQSVLGRGTTFTVVLPEAIDHDSAPAAADAKAHGEPQALVGQTAKVLIVDDDPMIQQLVRGQLEADGCEVLVAQDGVEALNKARGERPDVVILDIRLPRLDGWSVLSTFKSDSTLRQIPVVILSVEEERGRGFSLGAFDYLVKPVEPDRLTSVVSSAVSPGAGEVLVVDDDPETRELVGRRLRSEGFAVSEVSNGEEALLRVRHGSPALVILDLVMPGLDGFEVLQRLREDRVDCPVVVLTGKELTDREISTLQEGLAEIIRKGGTGIEDVVKEAKRFVARRRALKAAKLPKVLYVEDIAQNRDIVRRYLAGIADLVEAFDGEHGLEVARKELPELILMDLSLPRLDGWEATRQIKADESLASIPVVALTAHAAANDRERAKEMGCCDYLTKPVDRGDLIGTIRKHLDR